MVHFRIHLEGKPVSCWISIEDSLGSPVIPMGWDPHPKLGGKAPSQWIRNGRIFCACNGGFEAHINPGIHSVEVLGGAGTLPWTGNIEIIPGQLAVRIPLAQAPFDPNGWHACDLRTHGLSPKAALIEAEASGMALTQVLASSHWPKLDCLGQPDYGQLVEFSGSKPAAETTRTVIAVNTLNRHPYLGTVCLLHSHRPVYPWHSGWHNDEKSWSVHDWARQCHRIKGVVIWPELDPQLPEYESIAALIHGDIDCVELCESLGTHPNTPESRIGLVYNLWSLGIPCGLVGSSGKSCNRTRVGERFTWAPQKSPVTGANQYSFPFDEVMSSIRSGAASASNGPFLTLLEGPELVNATINLFQAEANLEWVTENGVIEKQRLETGFAGSISLPSHRLRNWVSCRLIGMHGELLAHSPLIKGPDFGKTPSIWDKKFLTDRVGEGLSWVESFMSKPGETLKDQLKDYFQSALDLVRSRSA